MTFNLAFWVVYIVGLVFGLWTSWPVSKAHAPQAVVWVLIGLLGWHVFGPMVHQ